jgi:hypothetical protein
MIGVMEAVRRSRKFVSLGVINNKHSVCPLISSSSQDQKPRLDEKMLVRHEPSTIPGESEQQPVPPSLTPCDTPLS